MPGMDELKSIVEAIAIAASYIAVSCILISFNKYLMHEDRFPYAKALTATHMSVTFCMSAILYKVAPSLFPTMDKATDNWQTLLKYLVPLGSLFALSLYCANEAYLYSSVAFLQFCKEGNVVIVFAMACAIGLQAFSWTKVAILSVVVAGCSLCVHGEIHFAWMGFALQLVSQFTGCAMNIIGEVVMTGSDLKLDVLTFVFWQAPWTLLPLMVSTAVTWQPEIWIAFQAHWSMLLLNALSAFALNLLVATTLKRLSAVAYVIIGIMKDSVLVVVSSVIFADQISLVQMFGFAVTMVGIALWGDHKIKERAQKNTDELKEQEPLMTTAKV